MRVQEVQEEGEGEVAAGGVACEEDLEGLGDVSPLSVFMFLGVGEGRVRVRGG